MTLNVWVLNSMGFRGADPLDLIEEVGLIPSFVDGSDPEPLRKQLDKNYVFGGWSPMRGTTFKVDAHTLILSAEDDPGLKPIAFCFFEDRDEIIAVYQHAIVLWAKLHKDFKVFSTSFEGRSDAITEFEVARLD